MKRLLTAIAASILLLAFFLSSVDAEEAPPPSSGTEEKWTAIERELEKSPPRKPVRRRGTLEISPEALWFFYEEPSLSVDWTGPLYGIRGAYTDWDASNRIMGRAELSYAIGRVDYDGFLSNGTPHATSGTDWVFEGRGLLGYQLPLGTTVLTPFSGIGYRYWFDNLESANAYRRRIRYLYSPIGLESRHPMGTNWHVGMRAEYDLFWGGWVRSHLSDVNVLFGDVDNQQDSGYGARASVYFEKTSGKNRSYVIEPFIRYWDIEESDLAPLTFAGTLIGSGQEPGNRTVEGGVRISLLF